MNVRRCAFDQRRQAAPNVLGRKVLVASHRHLVDDEADDLQGHLTVLWLLHRHEDAVKHIAFGADRLLQRRCRLFDLAQGTLFACIDLEHGFGRAS